MKKKLRYLLYSLFFFLPAQLLAQHVVISQIYGSGGNSGAVYTNDYVELYNPTSANVDMSTWSLQYQSAAGVTTFSGVMPFPSGAIIKAHGYYLVQLASGGSVGVALPVTADYIPLASNTTISFNMSGASGKVALCNSVTQLSGTPASTAASPPPLLVTTSIVDFVAYGTVNYNSAFTLSNPAVPATASATGAAPGLTATTCILRLANSASTATTMAIGGSDASAGNGYDIDVNSAEFVLETLSTAAVPRNTASPVAPALAVPALTVTTTPTSSPSAVDFGTTQTVNTSTTKTFTVSGANLTAGANLTVTGTAFTISTDNITFGATASITSAFTSAQTIYVKFTPTTTTAASETITITSTGATNATVALTGTGAAAPVASLTVTPTSLAFGSVNQGVPSVKTYTISGANLGTNSATVGATAPYTLSKASAGPFTSSLIFTPAELTATTAPTVYVQFSPTATGAANSTITNTDPDVTTGPSVTVTGTGVVPVLTATTTPATSPTSIDFGSQTIATSATKSYVLTGANIITGSTTTVTSNNAAYTVSKTSGSGYATFITFSATEIAAGPTVYVQFTAGTLGATPASISNTTTGTGATGASVTLTGTSVAAPVPLLTLAPTTLTFSGLVGSTSAAQTYTITGANITGASSATVAAPYSVSKTLAGTYSASVNYTTADFPSGSGVQTVYVKFSPTVVAAGGVNNGSSLNITAGGSNQSVTLNGTGIGVPALTATGSPLTFSQIINTTSAAQSFTLSGAYITANTTLSVTGPYTISKTSTGGYGTSLIYSTTEMASTQTVYVQFTPTAIAVGGANNSSIGISSTGAASQTVVLNGTGLAVPTLAATPATIAFPVQSIAVASAGTPFSLTATNLTTTTTVSTIAPFGLSKTLGGTYTTSIIYTPAELAAATNVYVNFAPTTTTAFTGTVTVFTAGATNATVVLTGTGIPPPNVAPTLNAITDVSLCYTTTQQTIALSGISPTETTQGIVSVGVTSNNPGLFSQLGVLPLTATTAQINYTVQNGVSGTAVVTVTVKDNGGTANGGIDTYTRTFNLTINPLAVITITADTQGPVEKGKTVQLTATGGTTYTWTAVNAGDIVSGANTATVILRPGSLSGSTQTKGPFVYTLTATNGSGCPTVQTYTVNTFSSQKLVTSNVITPNGDGINDTWQIVNIELYPSSNVKVFDKAGKIVFTQDHYLNTWNGYGPDGSPLTQGTYYYVVDLGGGTKYNGYISIVRD